MESAVSKPKTIVPKYLIIDSSIGRFSFVGERQR
jgi:hypothetical protein